jgi:iron complex outermembrane recepter protein
MDLRKLTLALAFCCLSSLAWAQGVLKGTIKNASTGETLIGATVSYGPGKGTTTDIDGNYSIELPNGEYEVNISYVGFTPKVQKIKMEGKPYLLDVSLESTQLKEVEVVADVARARETPIAFTNVSGVRIQEESASRDLPMVLNSTPGVYATEQGGGMGDSRINIRGFDQRNVAVMVDGVPVNDMENGQVFWSNWDNLGEITRTMQVQRGLGASKLAIPSVGGTINIMTKGIDSKKGGYIRQEIGNNNVLTPMFGSSSEWFPEISNTKTSFGYNSGRLKGGWGITFAGSYRQGKGWVDKVDYEAWGYFLKIQKEFKNQMLTFSVSGAPQTHGQRAFRVPVAVYNTKLASELGISDSAIDSILNNTPNTSGTTNAAANYSNSNIGDRGSRYNAGWGFYTDENGVRHELNPSQNIYHKPQFNLSHFWTPNEKFTWSNVAYLSIGRGGGEAFVSTSNFTRDSLTGVYDYTTNYQQNSTLINKGYDSLLSVSNKNWIIRRSVNNHFWYGLLSTLNYNPIKRLSIMGGLDLRSYRGTHYQEIANLFGGDYYIGDQNNLEPRPLSPGDPNIAFRKKKEGDKINYYNDGKIRWFGAFAQGEYKGGNYTVFINGSYSLTGYQRVDYFRKKDVVLSDTILEEAVGWGDTLTYNGNNYTLDSKEARYNTQDWRWFPGFTLKMGSNYNLDEHNSIFINTGILSIAPRYAQFYNNTSNQAFPDVKQQIISAVEIGYGLKLKKHALNVNIYYTYWSNKPPSNLPTINIAGDSYNYVLTGINTQSIGLEIDATGYLTKKLQYEVIASIADWRYKGNGVAYLYTLGSEELEQTIYPITNNIHTGDAAQLQAAFSLRYEPFKGAYIKYRFNYFGNNYSTFDPLTLRREVNEDGTVKFDNEGRESWKMPDYYFMELHAGYTFKVWKLVLTANASIINLLNQNFITDAVNGTNFDAATANVFVAQGRRINVGLKIAF